MGLLGEPQFFIECTDGHTRILRISAKATVQDFTLAAARLADIPVHTFYIIFGSKYLDERKSLAYYGIGLESTVLMKIPCKGGGPTVHGQGDEKTRDLQSSTVSSAQTEFRSRNPREHE